MILRCCLLTVVLLFLVEAVDPSNTSAATVVEDQDPSDTSEEDEVSLVLRAKNHGRSHHGDHGGDHGGDVDHRHGGDVDSDSMKKKRKSDKNNDDDDDDRKKKSTEKEDQDGKKKKSSEKEEDGGKKKKSTENEDDGKKKKSTEKEDQDEKKKSSQSEDPNGKKKSTEKEDGKKKKSSSESAAEDETRTDQQDDSESDNDGEGGHPEQDLKPDNRMKKKKGKKEKSDPKSLSLDPKKVKIFRVPSTGSCKKTKTNRCGEVCHCFGGKEYCCRQRKSWNDLSSGEKRTYVETVVRISTGRAGRGLQDRFNRLLKIHEIYWRTAIHDRTEFFPWHRAYLLEMENLLREGGGCSITIPYWDWTINPNQWWTHDVFNWFGENIGTNPQCVPNGYFSRRFTGFTTLQHQCLVRQWSYQFSPATYHRIQNILRSNFDAFEDDLRFEHGVPHYIVGGEEDGLFFTDRAAEDPLFFLHHSNVEFQFYQRQVRILRKKWREFWGRRKTQRLEGMPRYRMEHVINPFKIGPGEVCIEYVESKDGRYEDYLARTGNSRSAGSLEDCRGLGQFPAPIFDKFRAPLQEEERFLHERTATVVEDQDPSDTSAATVVEAAADQDTGEEDEVSLVLRAKNHGRSHHGDHGGDHGGDVDHRHGGDVDSDSMKKKRKSDKNNDDDDDDRKKKSTEKEDQDGKKKKSSEKEEDGGKKKKSTENEDDGKKKKSTEKEDQDEKKKSSQSEDPNGKKKSTEKEDGKKKKSSSESAAEDETRTDQQDDSESDNDGEGGHPEQDLKPDNRMKKKKGKKEKSDPKSLSLDPKKVKIFRVPSTGSCKKTKTNRCGEVCHCFGGKEYCCRQRKSWNDLSSGEKRTYVETVVRISTGRAGRGLQDRFNRLLKIHEIYWRTAIHDRTEFFPWHRAYLLEMENLLREGGGCSITIPYWDWTINPNQWWTHDVFNWFGENIGTNPQCVPNGYFSRRFTGFTTLQHQCLVRQWSYQFSPATYHRIQNILRSNFDAFEDDLRFEHGVPHYIVGGEEDGLFFTDRAAEDPLFFLHHSNVEFQFYQRQVRILRKKWREFWGRRKTQRLEGMPRYRMEHVINPFKIGPGEVCIEYVESKDGRYEDYLARTGNSRSAGSLEDCRGLGQFPAPIFDKFRAPLQEEERFLHERSYSC
eukprot:sb/3461288/